MWLYTIIEGVRSKLVLPLRFPKDPFHYASPRTGLGERRNSFVVPSAYRAKS